MSRPAASRANQLVRHWKMPSPKRGNLAGTGFRLSDYLFFLTEDIANRSSTFQHLRPDQMLFTITAARTSHSHGLQARVTPLRFKNGELTRPHRGKLYQVQRYIVDGREMLYLVTFCVPRFLDQSYREKLITIFHELYHVSPAFDGDLRRHDSRYEYHTHSKEEYDATVGVMVDDYLANHPDPAFLAPLHLDALGFRERYGEVFAYKIPQPKMIPVSSPT